MKLIEFLSITEPECYDLKDERGYDGKDTLDKILNYKKNDGFDCDGSLGRNYCKLIREIYRVLWGWLDIIDEKKVERYAKTCVENGVSMGPETMNSFQTTYTIANKLGVEREKLVLFAKSVGRIGNMTLTNRGYNRYIAYDYWDIKIFRQYIHNNSLSAFQIKQYINLFFQWDYVSVNNNEYVLKTFWKDHENVYMPKRKEEILSYINLVDLYTKRRGLFMVGMLSIANINSDDYKLIRKEVLMSEGVFEGYSDVIYKAKALKYNAKETYDILENLLVRINMYAE